MMDFFVRESRAIVDGPMAIVRQRDSLTNHNIGYVTLIYNIDLEPAGVSLMMPMKEWLLCPRKAPDTSYAMSIISPTIIWARMRNLRQSVPTCCIK